MLDFFMIFYDFFFKRYQFQRHVVFPPIIQKNKKVTIIYNKISIIIMFRNKKKFLASYDLFLFSLPFFFFFMYSCWLVFGR